MPNHPRYDVVLLGQHCLTKPCGPHSSVFHNVRELTNGSGATQAGAIFFAACARGDTINLFLAFSGDLPREAIGSEPKARGAQ
jgi:hypothetical protein